MKLNTQKRIAAKVLGISKKRVKLDPQRAEDIKEAITKTDIRGLVGDGAIKKQQKKGISRVRANKNKVQKSKGQRKGMGSKKGKSTAKNPKKEVWMKRIRTQREFLKVLKDKKHINTKTYTDLYKKAKGGFFRSKKHIKLYIEEHRLIKK